MPTTIFYSLRSKIFIVTLLIVLIPLIFSYLFFYDWINDYTHRIINNLLCTHLTVNEHCFINHLDRLQSLTRAISVDNTIKMTLRLRVLAQLRKYLNQLRLKNQIPFLMLVDADGTLCAISPDILKTNCALKHPLVQSALNGIALAGPLRETNKVLLRSFGVDVDRQKKILALEASFPVKVMDKIIGVVLAAIPISGNENLVQLMQSHAGVDAIAIVMDNKVVASTLSDTYQRDLEGFLNSYLKKMSRLQPVVTSNSRSAVFSRKNKFYVADSLIAERKNLIFADGTCRINIFRFISNDATIDFDCSFRQLLDPFYSPVGKVIMMIDHQKNYIILSRMANLMTAVLAGAFVLVVVLAFFVSRVISGPVSNLVRAVENFKEGDLDVRVEVKRADEIGQLAQGFNSMAQRISDHVSDLHDEIVARIQIEKRLAREKELLSVTLRSIGDGVISTDSKGRVVLMNKTAEKLTGWKEQEAVGRDLTEVFPIVNGTTREPMENPVNKVLDTGDVVELANNTVLLARDGKEKLIADSAAPVLDSQNRILGVVLVFRDVTEKYRLEEELARAYKLESLGVLAGGIAHDFNNLLTGIMGNLSLAKKLAGENLKVTERLDAAEKAAVRARDLAGQLLTFARGGAPVKQLADIKKLIQETAGFALTGTSVRCELEFEDDLWAAEVDYGQISQVINNLIINARDAMPEGGIITVKCENCVFSEDVNLPLKPGKYLKIIVADQGHGIPERYLSRIFEPYFTRKKGGHGLGLSIVYSIIKRHEGHISVASKEGYGTTFTIYLPATDEKIEQKETSSVHPALQQGGRVLVMDDDELVGDIAVEALEELGFEADLARDGTEAIELYKKAMQAGSPYLAVIMDITIPGGMGGKEAIKYLKEIDPQVKAIVSSGYANDPVMAQYKDYGFAGVLAKPYTLEALEDVLMTVLG